MSTRQKHKRLLWLSVVLLGLSFAFGMRYASSAVLAEDLAREEGEFSFVKPDAKKMEHLVSSLEAATKELHQKHDRLFVKREVALTSTESQNLFNLAKQRKAYLIELMRNEPDAALSFILSEKERKSLSSIAPEHIEKLTTLEGTLEVIIADNFEERISKTFYTLIIPNKERIRLYPAYGLKVPLISGAKIKIKGFRIDNELIFDGRYSLKDSSSEQVGIELTKQIENQAVAGDQKTIVILFNFSNDRRQPAAPQEVRNQLFDDALNSLNVYYQEQSFSQVSLSGDVVGWYTLGIRKTCDAHAQLVNAISLADPEVDFRLYERIVLLNPYCLAASTVGKTFVSTQDGLISASVIWLWLSIDEVDNFRDLRHEFGHSFGVRHANAWECGEDTIRNLDVSGCSSLEYGDPFDVMGGAAKGGHLNAFHKEKLGWLEPSNIITPTERGEYFLSPIEILSRRPQVLKFPRSAAENISVEFRQPIGIDKFLEDNFYNAAKGALLHTDRFASGDSGGGDTQLLDATPGSRPQDFPDAALEVGQSFIDPATRSEITVISQDTNELRLKFEPGKIDFTPPQVSILEPKSGTEVSGEVRVEAEASDVSGIEKVEFYYQFSQPDLDRQPTPFLFATDMEAPYEAFWETRNLPNGEISIFAQAYDLSGINFALPGNSGLSQPISVRVNNEGPLDLPPIANAGPDQRVTVGEIVTLNGSASYDPDSDPLSYQWKQLFPDSAMTLSHPEAAITTFIAPNVSVDTEFIFELTVTANAKPRTDTTLVIVQPLPDVTPPTTPIVREEGEFIVTSTQLTAFWSSEDKESGIAEYQYAIGTLPGATDVVNWKSAGINTSVTETNLSLQNGKTYYFAIKARNGAGLWSEVGYSDGIIVDSSAPVITHTPKTRAQKRRPIVFRAKVSETGSGLDSVWLGLTYFDSSQEQLSMTKPLNKDYYQAVLPRNKAKKDITYSLKAKDKAGNLASVGPYRIKVR